MKPDWKDAPEWANYLAMDPDGCYLGVFTWRDDGGECDWAADDSREARPAAGASMALPLPVVPPEIPLRAWLAGQALNGILAGNHPITHEHDVEELVADVAVTFADAVIERLAR